MLREVQPPLRVLVLAQPLCPHGMGDSWHLSFHSWPAPASSGVPSVLGMVLSSEDAKMGSVPWSALSHCPKAQQTPPAAELAAAPQLPVCPTALCAWHSAASALHREAANRAGRMKLEQRHGAGLRQKGPEPQTNRGVKAKPMRDVLCPGLGKASSGCGSGCAGSELQRGGGSSLEGALLPGQRAPTRLHHLTAFHCLQGAAGDPLVSWR